MALKLSDLNGHPKPLSIDMGGAEPLNITYYPDFISEEFESNAKALGTGTDSAKGLANMLYPIVAGWDIEDVEYSRQALVPIKSVVLSKILAAIMKDARPNLTTDETSAAG